MSGFRFAPAAPADAVAVWSDSPHATVFTHPDVLGRLSQRVDWWMAWKGQEPICAWPVALPDGVTVGIPEFTYWIGPLWSRQGFTMPPHRWLSASMSVYEGLIVRLLRAYGRIHAQLPVGLDDVRVFDWWNYHQPGRPRFSIRPRYSACVRDLQGRTANQIHAGFRELRRRELRRVTRGTVPVRATDWTEEDVVRLYREVMERQQVAVSDATRTAIIALVGLVALGMGEVIAFRDSASGELVSVVLLLEARGTAHMVLNLTATRYRGTGIAAWTVAQAILGARERGLDVFDFNGANSPARGDDKHSYGAVPELFFELAYPGPQRTSDLGRP